MNVANLVEQSIPASPRVPAYWNIIRMHPNFDVKAERQLQARGVAAYVPKEIRKVKGAWNKRLPRPCPIFPGLLFVPDVAPDLDHLKEMTDGIGGFIRRCGEPLKVSLKWMEAIRKFEAKLQGDKRRFHVGQQVRITSGIFEHWEAKVERLDRNYRIRVLIELLSSDVPLDLDEDQVEAV